MGRICRTKDADANIICFADSHAVGQAEGHSGDDVIVYVTHRYAGSVENLKRAKKILRDLAVDDAKNTYICPLFALSHLANEVDKADELEQRFDLLTCCELLVVASPLSRTMRREVELAERLGMEVYYLDRAFEE